MGNAKFFQVDAGVRYWEDACLNGIQDVDGQIPLRVGDRWQPVIELDTGRVMEWPEGVVADVCYKVCDTGVYWLLDAQRQRVAKWKGYYVPVEALCPGEIDGNDYIIFSIGADGVIANWAPVIDQQRWIAIPPNTNA